MDTKKLTVMVVLVVVILVAIVLIVKRTGNGPAPMATMEEANKKLDMIDMKTLEIFSETSANWEGKYKPMPDAPDHFKNPKTGEYTVVAAMKCASCGQLIPKPEIPADLLPPPPPPEEKGSKMAEIAGKQKYMQAKAMAMMKVLREYKCPKCGKSAWTREAPAQ